MRAELDLDLCEELAPPTSRPVGCVSMKSGNGVNHNQRRPAEHGPAAPPSPPCPSSIEFFGLPGSGKTTLAREVRLLLDRAGRSVSFSGDIMGDHLPFRRRSLHRLKLIARDCPLPCRFLLEAAADTRPGHAKDELKSIWNYCSVLAMMSRHGRCRSSVLVLDQGIVQAIWTGRMHGRGDAWHRDAAALIAADWFCQCLFVHVRAAKDLACSRLQARVEKTSRLQRPESIGRQALWDRAERIDTKLAGEIEAALGRSSPRSRFVEITNDGRDTPRELAARILRSLRSDGAAPRTGQLGG